MLIMFRVKNFLSFQNEVVLDLRATDDESHLTHIVKTNEINVLKTIAIYGANGSGKSNLLMAIDFFKQKLNTGKSDLLEHFLLTEEPDTTSEFEIIFSSSANMYQYGFECDQNKIYKEWYIKNSVVQFDDNNEKTKLMIKDYADDAFYKFINERLCTIFELSFDRTVDATTLAKTLAKDKNTCQKIGKILAKIESGIVGLVIKEGNVLTVHNVYDVNGNITSQRNFALSKESIGTVRFIDYLAKVIALINNGSVAIVDEISTRLHPLITKLIIDLFQAKSNNQSQLIFTTHDVTLLKKSQFRRDEVVFVEKDKRGVSTIYSLAEINVDEDSLYSDDYIKGKYGAIPFFHYDSIVDGDDDA